jgi:hypothetical protein
VDLVFTRMCEMTPMFVLGLVSPANLSGTAIPFLLMFVGSTWGFFIHANVNWRFGPLEWLISTPAFHHWHHTNDGPAYINKNYAPVLPWVDKMFGTLYLPKDKQPARYGIDQPISPVLFGQLVEPFMFWRKDLPVLVSVPLTGEAGETAAPEAEALLLAKTDVEQIRGEGRRGETGGRAGSLSAGGAGGNKPLRAGRLRGDVRANLRESGEMSRGRRVESNFSSDVQQIAYCPSTPVGNSAEMPVKMPKYMHHKLFVNGNPIACERRSKIIGHTAHGWITPLVARPVELHRSVPLTLYLNTL